MRRSARSDVRTVGDGRADRLRSIHREMCRGRAIEEQVLRFCEERVFTGIYHPGIGQEAAPAAICSQLRPTDALYYAHRGITYLTAKGMDPVEVLGDFAGTVAGSTRGLGAGTVHCVDPSLGVMGQGGTLGSCFPLATGSALAFRLRQSDDIAVAFFGDGAAARGTFLEAAVMAVAKALPVMFVCENNGYAISATTQTSQGVTSLAPRAAGIGLTAVSVDGTDAAEVHDVSTDLIARCRAGGGPIFIEATTVRARGHYTGDLQPYRQGAARTTEFADPIERLVANLERSGVERGELEAVMEGARTEMAAAAQVAKKAALPGRARLFEGLLT